METEGSEINCPFCKTPMTEGYASLQGGNSVLYFSKERMSWVGGMLSALGKERETILDSYPYEHSRPAYKCNNCNAVLLRGTASPTEANYAEAKDLEREKEDLRDKVRMTQGFQ
jgi:hypothetical protein